MKENSVTPTRLFVCLITLFALSLSCFAQGTGTVKGQVVDDTGAAVPATDIRITGPRGFSRTLQSDAVGSFTVSGLAPGNYTVRTNRTGFAVSSVPVAVEAGRVATISIPLKVEASKQEVTVQGEAVGTVSVEASANASQLVLKQAEIDALPDDPDDLAADLQALAGPSAGPNGGQIYIDGFTGGTLPPKSSIREIRINQNPFSAEYDRLGFGRIEILTKPGTDRLRGSVFFSDSDGMFNSRNPFSQNKPDFSRRMVSANVGGPINKKTSYFIDFERRDINDNANINATVLDPKTLQPTVLQEAVVTPNQRTEISPRIDYALNDKNTLVFRYQDERGNQDNAGLGLTTLPTWPTPQGTLSRTYQSKTGERGGYVTETAVISAKVINETRFRFMQATSSTIGDNSIPTISVSSAFTGGGTGTGHNWSTNDSYEVQNYTSIVQGPHSMKFGVRLRASNQSNNLSSNFNGNYSFTGSVGPYLDANNNPIGTCNQSAPTAATCQQLTSLEQYRRTIYFTQLGMSPAAIRLLGGEPNQYSVTQGFTHAHVGQIDSGLFLQDDWRVRSNVTLSVGLRWETQTNIGDHKDIAPRIAVAWSPDSKGGKSGKTVIRTGWGLFYDRFSVSNVLTAERYNGLTLTPFILQFPNPVFALNPANGYMNITPDQTQQLSAQSATRYQIDPQYRAPYISQGVIGVDRQLPKNTTVSVNYMMSRGIHMARLRNINAPCNVPDTSGGAGCAYSPYIYGVKSSGVYPYFNEVGTGVLNNYESDGFLNQKQLIVNVNSRISNYFSIGGFYQLGWAKSDTDGSSSTPMNAYNFAVDYGRAQYDTRHRSVIFGSIATTKKYGNLRFSPFISMRSGAPFDITVGRDLNGDTYFDDRPAFAPAGSCPSTDPNIKCTKYGNFLIPSPGVAYTPIPRNYGTGPGQFTVNLRMSRTWGFGEPRTSAAGGFSSGGDRGPGGYGGGGDHGRGGPGGGMRGGPGGMRGGGMRGGGDSTGLRYNVTLAIFARNMLNTVNPGPPVGSLGAANFGQSLGLGRDFGPGSSSANNRSLDLSIRFSF